MRGRIIIVGVIILAIGLFQNSTTYIAWWIKVLAGVIMVVFGLFGMKGKVDLSLSPRNILALGVGVLVLNRIVQYEHLILKASILGVGLTLCLIGLYQMTRIKKK